MSNKRKLKNSKSTNSSNSGKDLLMQMDAFFQAHMNKIFWIGVILSCIFGSLLFEFKISEGTDDSGYILAAHDFVKGKAFPSWHGSFYPIFISLPIALFGLNLFVLKFISFLLIIGHFILFFFAFRNRLQPAILCFIALIIAINAEILYHASSTYSEPLFFFLQALTLFTFLIIIDKLQQAPNSYKSQWKWWLLFGLSAFLLSLTRNIGLGIIITFVIYFIINKQYKGILYGIVSFLIFQIPYTIYKNIFWKIKDVGFESQFNEMFYKNPYIPAMGKEDFSGFVVRFLQNTELYLSKHFFKVLGLRGVDSVDKSIFLTVLIVVLFVVGFVFAIRNKNKYMQFIALYLGVSIGATFLTQQISWDQVRLILIYIPLMLVFLGYTLYEITKTKMFKGLQFIIPLLLIIIFFASFNRTSSKVKTNRAILTSYLKGNKYSGFTPDWVHFFQISEWAAKNVPADAKILSRKPSMSFIYSEGREFASMYKLPMLNLDTAISALVKKSSNYLVVDNQELENKGFPNALFDSFRPYNKLMIIGNSSFYTVYEPAPEKLEMMKESFIKSGISIKTDLKSFYEEIKKVSDEFYAEDADFLVNYLKTNNIKYIILANLRANPAVKNGNIINTLHRFVLYTQFKYPGIFRSVYQIGAEEDEPAQLIEVLL